MTKLNEKLNFFLKGIFMGLSDIVPGVSGGTIALITGIYERLIRAIISIDLKIPLYLIKLDLNLTKEKIKEIDFEFLVPLISGVAFAFLIASKFILISLKNYPLYTYSFFFGLILGSVIKLSLRIEKKDSKHNIFFLIIGSIFSFYITGLETLRLTHSPLIILLSGFIAICAMILPGISGSFILLTLGQYQYMLEAINDLISNYKDILLFLIGALISIFTFSRLLSKLLERYESFTYSFLVGLMGGALRLPGMKIFSEISSNFFSDMITSLLFGLIGLIIVLKINENR